MGFEKQLEYWTHMLDESMGEEQMNEKDHADGIIVTDEMIDDSSVKKWSCFTDEKILKALSKVQNLNEDEPISGAEWRKMPFWKQAKDIIVSGQNYDGSKKGWFESRKFPVKVIKDQDMTADAVISALRAGYSIQRDSSGATSEQVKKATEILSKGFDAVTAASYDKMMQDVGNVAGSAAGAYAYVKGGNSAGAAAATVASKAAVTKFSDSFVQEFNQQVNGTEYEAFTLTQEDLNRAWYERVLLYVMDHPYISIAAIVALIAIYKNRAWIWDRIKLGFNNLWQGKVIARYELDLNDGTPLSLEYDLRFNRWRLLYRGFQWTGSAYPNETMVKTFMKTSHCKSFIEECSAGMEKWIQRKDQILQVISVNDEKEFIQPIKMIKAVLDDIEEIRSTMPAGAFRIG